ncbi:WecB/TagA/CpsF family glycosyltransferase [Ferrimonas sediminicola]|uniref:WecB/TagA/CpsF family glycosyltransferase n=1 Tax=Ferrimonas sediminicola TaxID=2569538 RepID=A0A4U1BC28_9GAMM|nr:WecB/TagA/CpsF family glycosyltransferase [Ferrimonas sediminicola]TKB48190.1 WecB/TagA/CpsF family glycosyltransferase [Ferrimonas sediminicola]
MRILHLVRQFAPAVGGLENFVRCLVREQRRQGVDARVLTLDRVFHQDQPPLADQELVDGIPVIRIPYRGSYKYPLAPSVLKHLASFDLIHVHGVDFFADFLALTRRRHRKPLCLSTHGGYFHTKFAQSFKRLYFQLITRYTLSAYTRVFACSVNDEALFRPLAGDRLQLLENGVELDKFTDAGSKAWTPHLLCLGRFSDNKRIDRLLLVMDRLRRRHPDVRLSIIGRDWDGNLDALLALRAQLQLEPWVSIETDLDDAAIRKRIGTASFIVSASEYEGFGLTLVEGMSAGLIPLASPIPSFRRIVERAGIGTLVDFDAPEAATDQLHQFMLGCRDGYPQLRQQAMTAAQRYAWPGLASRFIQAYREQLTVPRVIQGVAMDARSGEEIIHHLDDAIDSHTPVKMAYANAHTINLARQDGEFRTILNRFLVVNDGVGVEIASRWKYGRGFQENLNGTDFTPRYLAESRHQLRVFLLGADQQSVQGCFEVWRSRFPRHQWVGFHHGFAPESAQAGICDTIRQSGANLVVVAMGNPRQEQWIETHLEATGATLAIGVGALFDFTAGRVSRAPPWMRAIRVEWAYRLAQEPRRMWRRYLLGNLSFLFNAWGDQS